MSVLIEVPGGSACSLEHLLLDVNGTLARDGQVLDGVAPRVGRLAESLAVWLVTADTFGTVGELQRQLGIPDARLVHAATGADKVALLARLDPRRCAAIGNGANDADLLRDAALGVAVLGPEGACPGTIAAADIVCGSILDALDLLIHPRRVTATLRR